MWKTLKSGVKTPKPRQKAPWELVEANQALRRHISIHLLVLERTLNDIISFLSLVELPALDKEGFLQFRELIEGDQFLDCTYDEARNTELWGVYEKQMNKASKQGALNAKRRYMVHLKKAGMVAALVASFLAAAGLATGVAVVSIGTAGLALPLIAVGLGMTAPSVALGYDHVVAQSQSLATQMKDLDEEKRTCELLKENGHKQTARLNEVGLAMSGDSDSANMHLTTIQKMMRGSGCQTENAEKVWRTCRSPERLDIFRRYKEHLSTHIGEFEKLVTDLKKDLENP